MSADDQGPDLPAQPEPGARLVNVAVIGTGAFLIAAVAGAAAPDTFGGFTAAVSGLLFVAGVVLFLWGYANGVVRSKDEQVTFPGLFLLSHTAPRIVRVRLRGALAVQVVAAFTVAVLRTYTSVAFAVLAPMFGLGVMAMWGARYGTFFPKADEFGPDS